MATNKSLSKDFKKTQEIFTANTVLNPAVRKTKLVLWFVRTAITATLYFFFWKYEWVQWSLVVTIPLSLLSLFMIVGMPYILRRKIDRLGHKIETLESRKDAE